MSPRPEPFIYFKIDSSRQSSSQQTSAAITSSNLVVRCRSCARARNPHTAGAAQKRRTSLAPPAKFLGVNFSGQPGSEVAAKGRNRPPAELIADAIFDNNSSRA